MRIVLQILGILILIPAVSYLTLRYDNKDADGPSILFPGGELVSGELYQGPEPDWSFTDDVNTIELQQFNNEEFFHRISFGENASMTIPSYQILLGIKIAVFLYGFSMILAILIYAYEHTVSTMPEGIPSGWQNFKAWSSPLYRWCICCKSKPKETYKQGADDLQEMADNDYKEFQAALRTT